MAMAAPKVTRAQASKIASAVGSPKKRTTAQRNSKFATKQYAKRQRIKLETETELTQRKDFIRSQSQATTNRIRAQQQQAQSNKPVRSRIVKAPLRAAGSINSSLANSGSIVPKTAKPAVNPILLIIFTWAAIVLLYVLITSPTDSSRFMASMRSWIGLIYTTKPVFKVAGV